MEKFQTFTALTDWSDWLGFLIERSCGSFNRILLERPGFKYKAYAFPKVDREVVSGGYRSDIVILWRNKHADHMEVKVGDPGMEKTYGTSVAMRKKYGKHIKAWSDWILILDRQQEDWDNIVEKVKGSKKYTDIDIQSITWIDVAIAIRKCLYNKLETITWMTWAVAFTGAIESTLYNIISMDMISNGSKSFLLSDAVLTQETILSRSMYNEESK
ncbi:hypothetical protein ACFL20_12945 [Spirochaetota bacterium]